MSYPDDMSEVSRTLSSSWQGNTQNRPGQHIHPGNNQYAIYANGHPQHSSPPLTARDDHATRSPTLMAHSPQTSAQSYGASDGYEDHKRHLSDGSDASELGYAEMVSQEPQVVESRYSDKVAYRHSNGSTAAAEQTGLYTIPEEQKQRSEDRRRCGMTVPIFWLVTVGTIIAVLALGLGLGIPLGIRHRSSSTTSGNETALSQTMIGGDITPAYFSREGIFNGSGVALASANNGVDADIFVFYQTFQGEIRQLLRSADGSFHAVTTVASNARNATPLSVVAYVDGTSSVSVFHLFYIDRDNIVREKTSSNASQSQENIWYDGPLSELDIKSHDSELVGMQACYWGNYYGTQTNNDDDSIPTKSTPETGINLFYASDDSTFTQYDWTNGQDVWNKSNTFSNMNTNAGVACQTWLTNTTSYVFMVDQNDTVRIYWRDTDVNKTSTDTHPINAWTLTNISIPNVHPSTSLGYTDFLAYQDSTSLFRGRNVTWAAENTSFATVPNAQANGGNEFDEWVINADSRGIPGSHMAITALDQVSGGRQLALFYQSIAAADGGDGMTIGLRDSSYLGAWGQAFVQTNFTQ